MNKYLKPWGQTDDATGYYKFAIDSDKWIAIVFTINESWLWHSVNLNSIINANQIKYETPKEAMSAADEQLIKDGFISLTEEQINKLEILM